MEHVTGVLSWLIFWAFVAAVIIVPRYLRTRDRERMYETMRIAFEKGQPVPPELIAAMQPSAPLPEPMAPASDRDLRRAIVLIAVGLGISGFGGGIYMALISVTDVGAWITGWSIAGIGAIPGLIGVAYLLLWLASRPRAKA